MTGVSELLSAKRSTVDVPLHATMPNGLFASVFETSYASEAMELS
jgi:hypothetical protein